MAHQLIRFALLAGILLLTNQAVRAQDKIYLDDGTVIDAKVKEISPRSVVYRRWDNQDGADYILTRREVNKIVYQNGTEEKLVTRSERPSPFNRDRDRDNDSKSMSRDRKTGGRGHSHDMNAGYGRNIIAFAPLQMTNESVAGIGVHYEHILDKAGDFSVYLPVAVSFFDENISYYAPSGTLNLHASRAFITVYPGAKFYPGGSGRRASYSVGPSFALGFGTKYKQTRRIDPGTGSLMYQYNEGSVFKAGFMINNGVNIQPTKKLYVGLELGVGILYYNNEEANYTIGEGDPIVQFNFKMGYRF